MSSEIYEHRETGIRISVIKVVDKIDYECADGTSGQVDGLARLITTAGQEVVPVGSGPEPQEVEMITRGDAQRFIHVGRMEYVYAHRTGSNQR